MFVFNNLFSFLSFRMEMIRFTDFLRLEMRLFCDELESHSSDGFSSTPGSSSSAVRIFLMNTSKLLEAK